MHVMLHRKLCSLTCANTTCASRSPPCWSTRTLKPRYFRILLQEDVLQHRRRSGTSRTSRRPWKISRRGQGHRQCPGVIFQSCTSILRHFHRLSVCAYVRIYNIYIYTYIYTYIYIHTYIHTPAQSSSCPGDWRPSQASFAPFQLGSGFARFSHRLEPAQFNADVTESLLV